MANVGTVGVDWQQRVNWDRLRKYRLERTRELFEKVRDDEAWSCAGLAQAIKRLGGTLSEGKGDFAVKLMAVPSLRERLMLLNRGQGWVIKRLDGLLGGQLDEETERFLRQMRSVHAKNIEVCDGLIAALAVPGGGSVGAGPGAR